MKVKFKPNHSFNVELRLLTKPLEHGSWHIVKTGVNGTHVLMLVVGDKVVYFNERGFDGHDHFYRNDNGDYVVKSSNVYIRSVDSNELPSFTMSV